MKTNGIPVNLTIAGFDPSGGGGLQADLKVFAALQTHGLSAATAITSQDSCQVSSVFPLPPSIVADQLKGLALDFSLASIKIGMIYTDEIVEVLADSLKEISYNKLIIDPVLSSKRGFPLASPEALDAMRKHLFPLADLVTPNLEEAALLAGLPELEEERIIKKAARIIGEMGPGSVLIKGGHGSGNRVDDWLFHGGAFQRFSHFRINFHDGPYVTQSLMKKGGYSPGKGDNHSGIFTVKDKTGEAVSCRGTGCALSSAIAAYLSRDLEMEKAVEKGINFVQKAINNSYRAGSGFRMLGRGLS